MLLVSSNYYIINSPLEDTHFPQETICPCFNELAITSFILPQSHKHLYHRRLCPGVYSRKPISSITVNLPNFIPIGILAFSEFSLFIFCIPVSLARQPHERVLPEVKLLPRTTLVLPQSHIQFQK